MLERLAASCLVVVLAGCAGCARAPHPPYWIVEHEGRKSLLVGTMHQEVDASVLPADVLDAIARARVLTTEADVRVVPRNELLSAASLPPGTSVRAGVTDDDWALIEAAVAPGLSSTAADRLQPWFLESNAVGARLPPVREPMDAAFVARGEAAGVPLAFFETWQEQVELLNGLGFDDGLEVLLRSVRDLDGAVAAHLAWAEAFQAGDLAAMTALAFDPDEVSARPRYYDEIVARHRGWLPVVEEQVRAGDAVIAAGFMHMLTDGGLPALLEDEGFAVTLVAPAP